MGTCFTVSKQQRRRLSFSIRFFVPHLHQLRVGWIMTKCSYWGNLFFKIIGYTYSQQANRLGVFFQCPFLFSVTWRNTAHQLQHGHSDETIVSTQEWFLKVSSNVHFKNYENDYIHWCMNVVKKEKRTSCDTIQSRHMADVLSLCITLVLLCYIHRKQNSIFYFILLHPSIALYCLAILRNTFGKCYDWLLLICGSRNRSNDKW